MSSCKTDWLLRERNPGDPGEVAAEGKKNTIVLDFLAFSVTKWL